MSRRRKITQTLLEERNHVEASINALEDLQSKSPGKKKAAMIAKLILATTYIPKNPFAR